MSKKFKEAVKEKVTDILIASLIVVIVITAVSSLCSLIAKLL